MALVRENLTLDPGYIKDHRKLWYGRFDHWDLWLRLDKNIDLQFRHSLVEEVGQVCCDGKQDGLWGHFVVVLPVPFLQQGGVIPHGLEDFDQLAQLLCVYLGGDGSVAVLLGPEVDKVGAHGVLLTAPQLVHAEGGGHVLVGHLVPHSPPHVHNLRSMICGSFPAILD